MNNDIKAGAVAFLKSTAEPAFVLEIKKGPVHLIYPDMCGMVATVRRPTQGRDGVKHNIEFFILEELETLQEQKNRQVLEMDELKSRFIDASNASPTDVFATN